MATAWTGNFIDREQPKLSKFNPNVVWKWELSECGNWVIITKNEYEAKEVVHQADFHRRVLQKRYFYPEVGKYNPRLGMLQSRKNRYKIRGE